MQPWNQVCPFPPRLPFADGRSLDDNEPANEGSFHRRRPSKKVLKSELK